MKKSLFLASAFLIILGGNAYADPIKKIAERIIEIKLDKTVEYKGKKFHCQDIAREILNVTFETNFRALNAKAYLCKRGPTGTYFEFG